MRYSDLYEAPYHVEERYNMDAIDIMQHVNGSGPLLGIGVVSAIVRDFYHLGMEGVLAEVRRRVEELQGPEIRRKKKKLPQLCDGDTVHTSADGEIVKIVFRGNEYKPGDENFEKIKTYFG